jgi:hypothetical protein
MPRVPFAELPAEARVWIFASDRPLDEREESALLADVDAFLDSWKAHGAALRSAREWKEGQFLVIGVDPTEEQASGCSIDGLFRALQQLEQRLGTSLVAGGRVFYRDQAGRPRRAGRHEIGGIARSGELTGDTQVFDTSLTSAADYRSRFEQPARHTWVNALLGPTQASQASSRSATNSSSARNG